MRVRLLRGSKREPREPMKEEGTYKINIYKLKVPSVPSVPSIFSHTHESGHFLCMTMKNFSELRTWRKREGTEGTGGLRILVFPVPSICPGSLSIIGEGTFLAGRAVHE